MNDLNPEEVILRLESELDQYVNAKAHLPRLCADACEVIRKLIGEVSLLRSGLETHAKEAARLATKKNKPKKKAKAK